MAKVKKKCKKKVKKAKKAKRQITRTTEGKYPKGTCGNPGGRPKGSKNKFSVKELADAIKAVEGIKRKSFLEEWVRSAWGDATDMATIANFMLPKLRAIEQITFADDSMTDEEANEIRKDLLKRFKK